MRRSALIPAVLLISASFNAAAAWAQNGVAPQPAAVVVHPIDVGSWPQSIQAFTSVPPDITLIPRGEGARHGQIWIRTVSQLPNFPLDGFYIAGKVDGPPPDFPLTRDLLPSKDHIEIWLATSREVDLPEIGWDNQFGQEMLPEGAPACAEWASENPNALVGEADGVKRCEEWAESQERYRRYFKRLFVRQWLLAPKQQIETFATPAFEEISDWFTDPTDSSNGVSPFAKDMKPQGILQVSTFQEQSGYSFAVLVPFWAFPPSPKLDISDLYVLVDVFSAAPAGKKTGAYSTSSPARVWGNPNTFNVLRLDPPLSFPLTPCNLPLPEEPGEGNQHPTWVLPKLGQYGEGGYREALSDTLTIQNTFRCGAWLPQGLSPTVTLLPYFWMGTTKEIGVWVCGPNLTIARAGKSVTFGDVVGEEGMDYKQMPNGDLLIKFGPSSGTATSSGCGQGGAAPKTDLEIFDLDKDLHLHSALGLGEVIDGVNIQSQDFTISPDWSQVTEYDLLGPYDSSSWSSTTWCLNLNGESGYNYEQCGEKENVKPPDPPVLKQLRNNLPNN